MSDTTTTPHDRDRGAATITVMFAVVLSMLILVQFVNLLVFMYGKSVVRSALDEGARAGAVRGPAACQLVAEQLVSDLLGSIEDGVTVSCVDLGDRIEATANFRLDGWISSLGDLNRTYTASAAKESEQ